MSGLIWIQIVWHNDDIPENILENIFFDAKSTTGDDIKACNINYPAYKELIKLLCH